MQTFQVPIPTTNLPSTPFHQKYALHREPKAQHWNFNEEKNQDMGAMDRHYHRDTYSVMLVPEHIP